MPKLLSVKNFLGMQTTKRKLPPRYAREIQDMISERGLTRVRPGFTKYNPQAQFAEILGIFDYRRKSGQTGDFFYDTVTYEANELPQDASPPWDSQYQDRGSSVSGGILTTGHPIDDSQWFLEDPYGPIPDMGNVMEVYMKVITEEGALPDRKAIFGIGNGSWTTLLKIYEDKITDDIGNDYSMDTTDDFHVYRMTLKSGDAIIYVDGIQRLTLPPQSSPHRRFRFEQNGGGHRSQWDYVRCYRGGF